MSSRAIWCGVGSPIQLFSYDVLQNWLNFNAIAHHAKHFCLHIPQFIMALDDKTATLHIIA